MDYDVCIIGSGAGAGPVAYELALAGKEVLVLEKGPWFKTQDFSKDELACCRRSLFTPALIDEPQVIESETEQGWEGESTYDSGNDFWNGNMVGGSSNLMSGYFHRLKPVDFRLLSEFGPIEGANIVDWPIAYEDLEPFYAKTERIVGVSGQVVPHPHLEPRSTEDFPYPPLEVNEVAHWIDRAAGSLGFHPIPTPRAILSRPRESRNSCYYSNFCGSYGCSSDAKSSARAALLNPALKSGRLHIRPHSKVFKLVSDTRGKVREVRYYDEKGKARNVSAKIFVVACQAIETSRLLLASPGPAHPHGLGNNHGQVGRNLIFSGGGSGTGHLYFDNLSEEQIEKIKTPGLFVNRSLQDWYVIDDPEFGKAKGGTIDFLWRHANGITRANRQKWEDGKLLYGLPLKRKLEKYFREARHLRFEVFNDWLPTDDCFVTLDPKVKDKWGDPVARFRIGFHEQDLKVGRYLAKKAEMVLEKLGARDISSGISGSPPANLQAGGCRFGTRPENSVLDKECRVHDAPNLFVTDGSFMPTGGSVPYTFTIYANAFRVAESIKSQL